MKTWKALFLINLSFLVFLGIGWIYFYFLIIMKDFTVMPYAMTANETITGLNVIFIINLILLPITYRRRKT